MSLFVFSIVLAAAAMHASWNALAKSGGDPVLRIATMHLSIGLLALPALPFVAFPPAAAWPFLLASVAIHVLYQALLAGSYRLGDLSQVYPITRGISPPLVAVAAALFVGETLPPLGIVAVGVVAVGILALAFVGRAPGLGLPIGMAILNGGVIAAYTMVDGLGGRTSGDPIAYSVWLFALDGLGFGPMILWRRRATLRATLPPVLAPAVIGGALSMGSYTAVIWAMSQAPLAYVSALRETSVVIGVLLGSRLLGERFGGARLASACLVVLGVALLQVARPH
jgi:drug/metabolite transporter (DMT)-like permease